MRQFPFLTFPIGGLQEGCNTVFDHTDYLEFMDKPRGALFHSNQLDEMWGRQGHNIEIKEIKMIAAVVFNT